MAKKVLVIGWDAADWRVINPLLDEGKMPGLQSMVDNGVIAQPRDALSAAVADGMWTSIATGKRPFRHGILGFTEPTQDGSGVQPVSVLSRRGKAVWNILNQGGLPLQRGGLVAESSVRTDQRRDGLESLSASSRSLGPALADGAGSRASDSTARNARRAPRAPGRAHRRQHLPVRAPRRRDRPGQGSAARLGGQGSVRVLQRARRGNPPDDRGALGLHGRLPPTPSTTFATAS